MSETCIDVVLFGEFSLSYKGNVLAEKDYRSQKMWAVLAYLILNRQRPITQSELIMRFWDDDEGQNPANALKTLIFRLRKLLVPLVGEDIQPVVSTLGAYQWNPELPCIVDVDEFEACLHKCKSKYITQEEKMEYYQKAMELYRGEFLPKAINLEWHTLRSSYYQMQYSQAAYEYAELLEEHGKHEEMTRIIGKTLHQGVIEEKLYIKLIQGLLHQGNHTQALQQFEKATDILYKEFGVNRSEEMSSLYQEIMNESAAVADDIMTVVQDIQDNQEPGPYFCDFGFFKELYRMAARYKEAKGVTHVFIAMVTLSPIKGKELSKDALSHAMNALEKSLRITLQRDDVVSKYSSKQFVILLPEANYESSVNICKRIEDTFHKNWYHRIVEINYVVRPVEFIQK